ncbi:MAG TPA: molybdenum cofactor biosynthesis protein MoaE [Candidatus Limnocylindrales bacterium]|nr:molybdenum cofactor biosynthesis protein MoaE [Candidatus Limnocylindrales bacterium]
MSARTATATMTIRVRLFALQREQLGRRELGLELPAGASIGDAWRRLAELHPVLAGATESVRFACNGEYASATDVLAEGDELAIIPPVAGGAAGTRVRRIALAEEPIDDALIAELRRAVTTPEDGAAVVFVGTTRRTPGTPAPGQEREAERYAGEEVEGLDYEAFEPLTRSVLGAIADEIDARFGVRRLAMVHRVGEVAVGETSVVIVAAAPHREAAFDACRYAIEELKARAPVWKSERFRSGSVWLGRPARTGPDPGVAGAGGPEAREPRP